MREIEIKARLTDVASALDKLARLGITMSEAIKQHDVVYSEPGSDKNPRDANWLRIRIEDDSKVILTLKRSVTGELDSIEHEVIVSNAEEMTKILSYLGFSLYSDLTKTRQKGHMDNIEVCIDTIEGLGSFIEAEMLCDDNANIKKITKQLWAFFDKLEIARDQELTSGYDVLMRQQLGAGKS